MAPPPKLTPGKPLPGTPITTRAPLAAQHHTPIVPAVETKRLTELKKRETQRIVMSVAQESTNRQRKSWFREDVHTWTREMKQQLDAEFPALVHTTQSIVLQFEATVNEMKSHPTLATKDLDPVYSKLTGRRTIRDADMNGMCIGGMLVCVWKLVDQEEPSAIEHIRGMLLDMGSTCIQGDTHRMFSTYVALHRAKCCKC